METSVSIDAKSNQSASFSLQSALQTSNNASQDRTAHFQDRSSVMPCRSNFCSDDGSALDITAKPSLKEMRLQYQAWQQNEAETKSNQLSPLRQQYDSHFAFNAPQYDDLRQIEREMQAQLTNGSYISQPLSFAPYSVELQTTFSTSNQNSNQKSDRSLEIIKQSSSPSKFFDSGYKSEGRASDLEEEVDFTNEKHADSSDLIQMYDYQKGKNKDQLSKSENENHLIEADQFLLSTQPQVTTSSKLSKTQEENLDKEQASMADDMQHNNYTKCSAQRLAGTTMPKKGKIQIITPNLVNQIIGSDSTSNNKQNESSKQEESDAKTSSHYAKSISQMASHILYPSKEISAETFNTQRRNEMLRQSEQDSKKKDDSVLSTRIIKPNTSSSKKTQSPIQTGQQSQSRLSSTVSTGGGKKKRSHHNGSNFSHHLNPVEFQRTFFTLKSKNSNSHMSKSKNKQQQSDNLENNAVLGSPAHLQRWFEKLSVPERINCLTTTYPYFVSNLIETYQQMSQFGYLSIYLKNSGAGQSQAQNTNSLNQVYPYGQASSLYSRYPYNQPSMTHQKNAYSRGSQQYESPNLFQLVYPDENSNYRIGIQEMKSTHEQFFRHVRLTDYKKEHDTLTISQELVEDPTKFFTLMHDVTKGEAFMRTVQIVNRSGKAMIDAPLWTEKPNQRYLAEWLAAAYEETLWAHYNFVMGQNIGPNVRKNELANLFVTRSESLQSPEDLAQRWDEMGVISRKKLIEQLQTKAKENPRTQFIEALSDDSGFARIAQQNNIYGQTIPYSQDNIMAMLSSHSHYGQRFGYYDFQEIQPRSHAVRKNLEIFITDPDSALSKQQDSDFQEIVEYIQPSKKESKKKNSLEIVQFLSETPLVDLIQPHLKARKLFLCRELHKMIQEDLRNAILQQLIGSDNQKTESFTQNQTAKDAQSIQTQGSSSAFVQGSAKRNQEIEGGAQNQSPAQQTPSSTGRKKKNKKKENTQQEQTSQNTESHQSSGSKKKKKGQHHNQSDKKSSSPSEENSKQDEQTKPQTSQTAQTQSQFNEQKSRRPQHQKKNKQQSNQEAIKRELQQKPFAQVKEIVEQNEEKVATQEQRLQEKKDIDEKEAEQEYEENKQAQSFENIQVEETTDQSSSQPPEPAEQKQSDDLIQVSKKKDTTQFKRQKEKQYDSGKGKETKKQEIQQIQEQKPKQTDDQQQSLDSQNKKRRNRKKCKKTEEEVLNSFMRKLHGEEEEQHGLQSQETLKQKRDYHKKGENRQYNKNQEQQQTWRKAYKQTSQQTKDETKSQSSDLQSDQNEKPDLSRNQMKEGVTNVDQPGTPSSIISNVERRKNNRRPKRKNSNKPSLPDDQASSMSVEEKTADIDIQRQEHKNLNEVISSKLPPKSNRQGSAANKPKHKQSGQNLDVGRITSTSASGDELLINHRSQSSQSSQNAKIEQQTIQQTMVQKEKIVCNTPQIEQQVVLMSKDENQMTIRSEHPNEPEYEQEDVQDQMIEETVVKKHETIEIYLQSEILRDEQLSTTTPLSTKAMSFTPLASDFVDGFQGKGQGQQSIPSHLGTHPNVQQKHSNTQYLQKQHFNSGQGGKKFSSQQQQNNFVAFNVPSRNSGNISNQNYSNQIYPNQNQSNPQLKKFVSQPLSRFQLPNEDQTTSQPHVTPTFGPNQIPQAMKQSKTSHYHKQSSYNQKFNSFSQQQTNTNQFQPLDDKERYMSDTSQQNSSAAIRVNAPSFNPQFEQPYAQQNPQSNWNRRNSNNLTQSMQQQAWIAPNLQKSHSYYQPYQTQKHNSFETGYDQSVGWNMSQDQCPSSEASYDTGYSNQPSYHMSQTSFSPQVNQKPYMQYDQVPDYSIQMQVQNQYQQYEQQEPRKPEEDPLYLKIENQFYKQFDSEIKDYTDNIAKSVGKYAKERDFVHQKVKEICQNAFKNEKPQVEVFGSLKTGLALKQSDMDMVVTGLIIDDKSIMIDYLHAIADGLRQWDLVQDLKAIDTASIPVIKAHINLKTLRQTEFGTTAESTSSTDSEEDGVGAEMLPIDITIDDETPAPIINQFQMDYQYMGGFDLGANTFGMGSPMFDSSGQQKIHLGISSCNLMKDYVNRYPCLKEVAILLKCLLAKNDLNSAYHGGMSCYSAVLLIVAYMNHYRLFQSPNLTTSRLLMGFLDFYSNYFNPKLYGINTINDMSFYPLPQIGSQQFVIVDPVNPTNNTARTSYRSSEIFATFKKAFQSLKGLIMKQYLLDKEAKKQLHQPCQQPENKGATGSLQIQQTQSYKMADIEASQTSEADLKHELHQIGEKVQQSDDPEATLARGQQKFQPISSTHEQPSTNKAVTTQNSQLELKEGEQPISQAMSDDPAIGAQTYLFSHTNFVETFLTCESQHIEEKVSSAFSR